MLYAIAQFLGILSFLGGTAAAAVAATGHSVAPPVLFAQLDPSRAAEWVPVIANAIPAIGGALLAVYARWLQTRRKVDAGNDNQAIALEWKARFEDAQSRLNAVTAERDDLLAKVRTEGE